MHINLWFFLTVVTTLGISVAIITLVSSHKRKVKELEITALKIKQANIHEEVDKVVQQSLKNILDRIAVLETIVTDKSYELNEKITKLK